MDTLSEDWIRTFVERYRDVDEEDAVGLYWVAKTVWECLPDADDPTVMEQSLRVIGAMLAAGMTVGTCALIVEGFRPWPDQRPDAVLTRIRTEWQARGEAPCIQDAPWFGPPRSA